MYKFESRIRFSEIDQSETLTIPALVNYFQDCSTFQSEDLGLGIDELQKRGKAWVLSSWQIEVMQYPKFGEKITIGTWASEFSGLFGYRNFQLRDEKGQALANANSIWVFMDLAKGRPARPEAYDIEAYDPEPALEMEKVSRKITLPTELMEKEAFPVLRSQIDTNGHVNNAQYIQMALETAPECGRAGKIRVEYKKSAVMGDWIVPKKSVESDRTVVELTDQQGTVYAVVEFKEIRSCN